MLHARCHASSGTVYPSKSSPILSWLESVQSDMPALSRPVSPSPRLNEPLQPSFASPFASLTGLGISTDAKNTPLFPPNLSDAILEVELSLPKVGEDLEPPKLLPSKPSHPRFSPFGILNGEHSPVDSLDHVSTSAYGDYFDLPVTHTKLSPAVVNQNGISSRSQVFLTGTKSLPTPDDDKPDSKS